jgi:hypothetical protein
MHIEHSLRATLTQLQQVLSQLTAEEYARSLQILSNASIGQHTRHIIEFFQTLNDNYETGTINYDTRKRNKALETNLDLAQHELSVIMNNISVTDKDVLLVGCYSNEVPSAQTAVRSTYYREIVYNLEHAIHHMAMIKIGMRESTRVAIPQDFGVAPATIQYNKSVL